MEDTQAPPQLTPEEEARQAELAEMEEYDRRLAEEQANNAWTRPIDQIRWEELTGHEKEEFLQIVRADELHNIEAEQQIIGAMLHNNDLIWRNLELDSKHFFFSDHQILFDAIREMSREGLEANPITLKNRLKQEEILKEVGGVKYLARLVTITSFSLNLDQYANMIIELYKRRHLMMLLRETMTTIRKTPDHEPMDKAITALVSEVVQMDAQGKKTGIHKWNEVTEAVVKDFMDDTPANSTGIDVLDTILAGGLYPRKTYYFQARMKVGKTTLLSTIYYNMVNGLNPQNEKIPCLYIAAEMGEKEIHQRNMARIAGYGSDAFYQKRQHHDFTDKIQEQIAVASDIPGYFFDTPGIKFETLQYVTLAAVKRYGIKGFFLDYLGLVRPSSKGRSFNKVEFYEEVCEWISNFCKTYNVWCVSAVQTNREGFTRGGDAPTMYGDFLGELHRDEEKNMAYITSKAMRYSSRMDAGSKQDPRLSFHNNGPHFKDSEDTYDGFQKKTLFEHDVDNFDNIY